MRILFTSCFLFCGILVHSINLKLPLVKSLSSNLENKQNRLNVELLVDYKIGGEFFKGKVTEFNTIFPNWFFYDNGSIYLLNNDKELIVYHEREKKSLALKKIENTLNSKYHDNFINGFFVTGDSLYIGLNGRTILLFSMQTEEILNRFSDFPFRYSNFSVLKNGELMILNNSNICYISNTDSKSFPIEHSVPEVVYINNDTLAFAYGWGSVVNLVEKRSLPLIKSIILGDDIAEQVLFSGITNSSLIWLNYPRNGIWVQSIGNPEVRKLYQFNNNFIGKNRESPMQDSRDGIRVVAKNNQSFLILIMNRKRIQIYSVNIE